MIRTLLAAALAAALVTPAQAEESISAQLVDCSYIVPLADLYFADDVSTFQDATMTTIDYQAAAMRHAAMAGHRQPAALIATLAAEKKADWMEDLDPAWLEQTEYRDWVGFCRVVGAKAGVVLSSDGLSG